MQTETVVILYGQAVREVHMLGTWIRQQRKARNWTQKQLAELIGVTSQAVTQWEKGQRKLPEGTILISLARVFEVSVEDVAALAGGAPLELAQAAGSSDTEVAELQTLWPYATALERQLLLSTLRERARRGGEQTRPGTAEN